VSTCTHPFTGLFIDHLLDKISETVKGLETLFSERDFAAAKGVAIRLRYLTGIRRAARRWLDNH
jgi:molecular chaperone HscB